MYESCPNIISPNPPNKNMSIPNANPKENTPANNKFWSCFFLIVKK